MQLGTRPVRPGGTLVDVNLLLNVVCLCAAWCGACREYRLLFDRLADADDRRCTFSWIDIEDDADQVDGIDVETFPTLLLARGGEAVFFGPLPPHAQTLQRLIDSALAGDLPAPAPDEAVRSLARRLG